MACILIVDDDSCVRTAVKKILRNEPYEIIEAANGREAVKFFHQTKIDLMITDLVMPEKEGIETILEIRQNFPGVKIIAISGGGKCGMDLYLSIAKDLGANDVLSKPFKIGDLLNSVRKVMDCGDRPRNTFS